MLRGNGVDRTLCEWGLAHDCVHLLTLLVGEVDDRLTSFGVSIGKHVVDDCTASTQNSDWNVEL